MTQALSLPVFSMRLPRPCRNKLPLLCPVQRIHEYMKVIFMPLCFVATQPCKLEQHNSQTRFMKDMQDSYTCPLTAMRASAHYLRPWTPGPPQCCWESPNTLDCNHQNTLVSGPHILPFAWISPCLWHLCQHQTLTVLHVRLCSCLHRASASGQEDHWDCPALIPQATVETHTPVWDKLSISDHPSSDHVH